MRRLLLLLGLLWLGSVLDAEATCTSPCVQFKNVSHNGTSSTATFDSTTVTGNMVVVFVSSYYDGASNAGTPWTVADGACGHTYTSVDSDGSGSFGRVQIFRAYNITGCASHAVTVTSSASAPLQVTIVEFTTILTTDPNDVTNKSNYVTATSSYTSGTASATTSNNALLTGLSHWFNTGTTATVGTSGSCTWIEITQYGNTTTVSDEHIVQYCAVTTTGNYAATGTYSPTPDFSTTTLMAAFKMTGGAAAVTCTRGLLGVGCDR